MSTSLKCRAKRSQIGSTALAGKALGPRRSKRAPASSGVRPAVLVCRSTMVCCVLLRYHGCAVLRVVLRVCGCDDPMLSSRRPS
ncbi:hypothetical protein D3C79_689760 [compost metagenome]